MIEVKELRMENKEFSVTFMDSGEERNLKFYYHPDKGYLMMYGEIQKAKKLLKALFEGNNRVKLIVNGFSYDERIKKVKMLENISQQISGFIE